VHLRNRHLVPLLHRRPDVRIQAEEVARVVGVLQGHQPFVVRGVPGWEVRLDASAGGQSDRGGIIHPTASVSTRYSLPCHTAFLFL